jgi:hypothetical protein
MRSLTINLADASNCPEIRGERHGDPVSGRGTTVDQSVDLESRVSPGYAPRARTNREEERRQRAIEVGAFFYTLFLFNFQICFIFFFCLSTCC